MKPLTKVNSINQSVSRTLLVHPRMVIVVVALTVALIVWFSAGLFNVPQATPERFEIAVTPETIPISGEWQVRTYLFSTEDEVRTPVESNVTMMATLRDRSTVAATEMEPGGEVSFQIPENVVAVRFEAKYGGLIASKNIAGPEVLPGTVFWPIYSAALALTVAYLAAIARPSLRLGTLRSSRKFWSLFCVALFSAVLPVSYLVEVQKWAATGYYPAQWLHLSVYYFPFVPVLMWIVSQLALARFQKKTVAPPIPREVATTTPSPVGTRSTCKTCGQVNPEYVRNYCVRCGARLNHPP